MEIFDLLVGVLEVFFFLFIIFMVNCFPFLFIGLTVAQAIKRSNNHKYFKNNVVYYDTISGKDSSYKKIYNDVSKDKLEKFNTDDMNGIKNYLYDIFYRFEVAYSNLDYNTMKMLSTEQLYNKYHTGITLDLKVGERKVIENINRNKVTIYELDSTMLKQIASLYIEVSYYKYTVNKKGFVISGSKDHPVIEMFEVEFRKDFDVKKKTNCPNCGAKLVDNRCEYCKSEVKSSDFRISSIKRIIENNKYN